MFTGIMTASWRGFGFDKGSGYFEIRFGFIGIAFIKGDLWTRHTDLQNHSKHLQKENDQLNMVLYGTINHERT